MAKILIIQYIRCRLEYAAVVWNPHLKKNVAKLKKVQRDITRRGPGMQGLVYEERLEKIEITKLEERRERGDAINMYRCLTRKQFIDIEDFVKQAEGRSRGHKLKIQKTKGKKDVKKYSIPDRVVEGWNKLPPEVVEAKNIRDFKNEYDEHKKTEKSSQMKSRRKGKKGYNEFKGRIVQMTRNITRWRGEERNRDE